MKYGLRIYAPKRSCPWEDIWFCNACLGKAIAESSDGEFPVAPEGCGVQLYQANVVLICGFTVVRNWCDDCRAEGREKHLHIQEFTIVHQS